MPIGGMLTLNDVADSVQQGTDWKNQQDQIQRAKAIQAEVDAANKAGTNVIANARLSAPNGMDPKWAPTDDVMLEAAQARGHALAQAGNYDEFFRNEAAVQGQRVRVRQTAMQQYGLDGDFGALVRKSYPTIFDGRKVTGFEQLEAGQSPKVGGDPSATAKARLTFDDGTTQIVDPTAFVAKMKAAMVDPAKQAEMDAQISLMAAQQKAIGDREAALERVKGGESRQTEDVKTKGKLQEVAAQGANAIGLEGLKDQSARAVANITGSYHVEGANIAATAHVKGAEISSKGRVDAATVRAEATGGKATKANVLQDMIIKSYGTPNPTSLSGTNTGNPTTAALLQGAQAYMASHPGASEGEAINAAAKVRGLQAKPVPAPAPQSLADTTQ